MKGNFFSCILIKAFNLFHPPTQVQNELTFQNDKLLKFLAPSYNLIMHTHYINHELFSVSCRKMRSQSCLKGAEKQKANCFNIELDAFTAMNTQLGRSFKRDAALRQKLTKPKGNFLEIANHVRLQIPRLNDINFFMFAFMRKLAT